MLGITREFITGSMTLPRNFKALPPKKKVKKTAMSKTRIQQKKLSCL